MKYPQVKIKKLVRKSFIHTTFFFMYIKKAVKNIQAKNKFEIMLYVKPK